MVARTGPICVLLLITTFWPSRLHVSGDDELIEDKSVGRRGALTKGAKLLADTGKGAVKFGKMRFKLWQAERILLSGAKVHAHQFAVDHYLKLGDMKGAREDFFSIVNNPLQDIKIEWKDGDMVTYIARIGDREARLKQNYEDKSSVITLLKPATVDKRERGIVVHYCKLDRSTLCKVDIPPATNKA